MARKLKITENEKYNTLGHEIRRGKLKKDVEYGKKTENHGKRETST
uniref:Uncharacterized protein n=1 Tax=Trichinella nativa TaxID=6335 RepID=A0A0V1KH22_9BILA